MKGLAQIDYIIALGVFLVLFAASIQYVTTFTTSFTDSLHGINARSVAQDLLQASERNFEPKNWTLLEGSSKIKKIGLASDIFTFSIVVNNTLPYVINGNPVAPLPTELIEFNYSSVGIMAKDVNSTVIYRNGTNQSVSYEIITSDTIRFSTSLAANEVQIFTVYVDDNSNFTSRSVAVSGNNNLTEKILPLRRIPLIQNRKYKDLVATSYTQVQPLLGTVYEFKMRLYDIETNETIFEYGLQPPRRTTVIALQRLVLYQNDTAGIHGGQMNMLVW